MRFDALVRHCPMARLRVLDVGCARAELLEYLRRRRLQPAHYIGLEAQAWLVRAARTRRFEHCTIVQADFVRQPLALRVDADVIVFSGSLNLLSSRVFYRCVRQAWDAAGSWLAFNFLSSRELTGDPWLHWHRPATVMRFVRRLAGVARARKVEGYESGDCLIVVRKAWRRPRSGAKPVRRKPRPPVASAAARP